MNGIDERNRVIIDSYSGEAMAPAFWQLWRDYCVARNDMIDVDDRLRELGIDSYFADPSLEEEVFVWRSLTEEERAWSDAQDWSFIS